MCVAYFKIEDCGLDILFHRDEFARRSFKGVGNHWNENLEGPIDIPSGGSWILWTDRSVFFLVNAPGTFGPARGLSNMSRGQLLKGFASLQDSERQTYLKDYRGRSGRIYELGFENSVLKIYSFSESGLTDVQESELREGVATPHGVYPGIEHLRAKQVMQGFRNGVEDVFSLGKLEISEGYGTLHSVRLRIAKNSILMEERSWASL